MQTANANVEHVLGKREVDGGPPPGVALAAAQLPHGVGQGAPGHQPELQRAGVKPEHVVPGRYFKAKLVEISNL